MTTRHAGLALMLGVVLCFAASFFQPGYSLISPVDQTDFPAALDVLGDLPILGQWVTFVTIISLLLMSLGLMGLYPLASQQAGLGGRLLQFGIITSVIEWSILILTSGMRHFVIHLMQRSELPIEGSLTAADFKEAALATHMDTVSIFFAFAALFPLASIMVGLGLSSRFASTNLFKVAGYALVAAGVVGLVNFMITVTAPDVGILTLLWINNVALYVGSICLIIIGYGMYRGRDELVEESSSG